MQSKVKWSTRIPSQDSVPGRTKGSMNIADTILLVDDDKGLSRLVVKYLTHNDFEVEVETNGALATKRIIRQQPTLVILDIMLPESDGLSICRSVRPHYDGPILILTALGEDIDEVAGLETGADDYLVKPVRPRVLLAHIRALLRRSTKPGQFQSVEDPFFCADSSESSCRTLEYGELVIDSSSRAVYQRGNPVRLTSAEFKLLWLLASNAGRTLDRNTIQRQMRGFDHDGVDRTIDLRISKLRKKLGDNSKDPALIKSVRGVGYNFTQSV